MFFDFHHHFRGRECGIYNLDFTEEIPENYFSVGLHPNKIDENYRQNLDKIKELKKLDISKENKVKIIETKGISEVAELIKGADLVVSPDTSIVHLGKAFNKKMICIYRKELGKEDKNSILWGPNSEKAKIIFVEEKIKDGEEIDINHLNLDEFKKEMEREYENISYSSCI